MKKSNKKLNNQKLEDKSYLQKRKRENDKKEVNEQKYNFLPLGVEEISNLNKNLKRNSKNKRKVSTKNDMMDLNICKSIRDIQYYQILLEGKDEIDELIDEFNHVLFNSINNILYFVYPNNKKSIIFFDVGLNQKIVEIKNAHKKNITQIKHFLDKANKRDLILSLSEDDNCIKIWDLKMQCILSLQNINKKGKLFSACFINYLNQIYILTANLSIDSEVEPIKVYNLKGDKIKEIENSRDHTRALEIYCEKKNNKIYIITGNQDYMKSYDFNENKIYRFYRSGILKDDISYSHFYNLILINDKNDKIILMGINIYELTIFDFHSGDFITKIEYLDNGEYPYYRYKNKTYILYLDEDIIKGLEDNYNQYYSFFEQKVDSPKYGECFLSCNFHKVILWINQN